MASGLDGDAGAGDGRAAARAPARRLREPHAAFPIRTSGGSPPGTSRESDSAPRACGRRRSSYADDTTCCDDATVGEEGSGQGSDPAEVKQVVLGIDGEADAL